MVLFLKGCYAFWRIMGVGYILVNETKKEMISFAHLCGNKMKELVGNPAQSAITTWYLLSNQGDHIQFISDTYDDWPFGTGDRDLAWSHQDKTDDIIQILMEENILQDNGMLYIDEDEPDSVYTRNIVNVWHETT